MTPCSPRDLPLPPARARLFVLPPSLSCRNLDLADDPRRRLGSSKFFDLTHLKYTDSFSIVSALKTQALNLTERKS